MPIVTDSVGPAGRPTDGAPAARGVTAPAPVSDAILEADTPSRGNAADDPGGGARGRADRSGPAIADAAELAARTSTPLAGSARPGPGHEVPADARPAVETTEHRRSLGDALARGAIAGALGALAMVLTHKASSRVLLGRAGAAPEPGEEAAEEMAQRSGHALSQGEAVTAGAGIAMGYGALLGAVYGAVHTRVEPPAVVHALLLSGLSYAVTVPEGGLLPRLGLMPPPTEQSMEQAMVSMDAHLAYGVATAVAFEALR